MSWLAWAVQAKGQHTPTCCKSDTVSPCSHWNPPFSSSELHNPLLFQRYLALQHETTSVAVLVRVCARFLPRVKVSWTQPQRSPKEKQWVLGARVWRTMNSARMSSPYPWKPPDSDKVQEASLCILGFFFFYYTTSSIHSRLVQTNPVKTLEIWLCESRDRANCT